MQYYDRQKKMQSKAILQGRTSALIAGVVKVVILPSLCKYQQNRLSLMSSFNTNCFGQCLKTQADEAGSGLKMRGRGKKCLTLVQKLRNNIKTCSYETNQSTVVERARIEELAVKPLATLQTSSAKHSQVQAHRAPHHSHIIYGRYAASNINSHLQTAHIVPAVPRERRWSQASYRYEPFKIRLTEVRSNSSEAKPNTQRIFNQIAAQHSKIAQIREENEQSRKSSLFQGAKNIISKLEVSRNSNKIRPLPILQTVQKANNEQLRHFYENVRLCETQQGINNTHSTIKTDHEEHQYLARELSIDAIPMSPKSKCTEKYKNFRVGKLLGVGKSAHIYLCEQVRSNFLFGMKEIFKQSLQYPLTVERINSNIQQLMQISHPKIVSIYCKFQNAEKVCLVVEYCARSMYDELKAKGRLPMKELRSYLSDLIEGLVFLHQNDIVHGSINIFALLLNFQHCKIKLNISDVADSKALDFKADILSLAIAVHEMAYGMSAEVSKQPSGYEREKLYSRDSKQAQINSINSHLQEEQASKEYSLLNSFLSMLINWSPQAPLSAAICLSHPFFKQP